MSYVQIELGGELRVLKFTQATHAEIQGRIANSKNDMFGFYCIVWGGLLMNCMIKGTEPDFTFENVVDWCEELYKLPEGLEQVKKISTAYIDTLSFLKDIPANKKKVTKKQVQKTTKRNVSK